MLGYKVIAMLVALITAATCFVFCIGNNKLNKNVQAASKVAFANEEFSGMFGEEVLFSAEKVLFNKESINLQPEGSYKTFYQRTQSKEGGEAVYFKDLKTDNASKYLIEHNQFVMLENKKQGDNFVTKTDPNLTEGVIISLGQYLYEEDQDGKVKTAELYDKDNNKNPLNAGITDLKIFAKLNNKDIKDLPGARNVVTSSGIYLDFMYVIEQSTATEGFYEFTFTYLKNGVSCSGSFGFYLLFETSYSGQVGNNYTINPTLGWLDKSGENFEKTIEENGYVRYYVGKSGINGTQSFPTITYDYTKFSFGYTHTASGKIKDYVYTYSSQNVLDDVVGQITCTVSDGTSFTKDLLYTNKAENNLVTVVLTKPGTYKFSFEYIYTGYVSQEAGTPEMNLKIADKNLSIHGYDLLFSKYEYQSAEMRSLKIANDTTNKIDIIVPEGYDINGKDGKDIEKLKHKDLGFGYELVDTNSARTGDVLLENSLDALINTKTATISNIVDNRVDVDFDFQKTNQGSVWFSLTDSYDDPDDSGADSFYYYSIKPFNFSDLENLEDNAIDKIDYNSETSFNKTGYYLAFMKVYPSGLKDVIDVQNPANSKIYSYYQVFAFEYSTDTVNIDVVENEEGGKNIGAGKFTTKDVVVSWKPTTEFERKLTGYYYVSFANKTIEEILKTETPQPIESGKSLGSEVPMNSFAKYLIELRSEGKSATYKTFTIDRQDIQNVAAYVLEKRNASGIAYYSYNTDNFGNAKRIDNAITDSFATINWDHKQSGAKVFTTYTYTPFVANTTLNVSAITGTNSSTWITTNYTLGTTIGDFNLTKVENPTYVENSSVLSNQGIYVFTLKDEAGNTCTYLLVIDKTEAYFKIDNKYYSGENLLFGDTVRYEVGTHKAMLLESDNLKAMFNAIYNSNIEEANYYKGNNSNFSNLSRIFQRTGGKDYLTVPNLQVTGYDAQNEVAFIKNLEADKNNAKGQIEFSREKGTSLIVKMYLKGENHRNSSEYIKDTSSKSWVVIEINTDNSNGLVYYGDTTIDAETIKADRAFTYGSYSRLFTDSDTENRLGIVNAHATNAKHVGFFWTIGTGAYEVESITYKHYQLNTNKYNDKLYFYNQTSAEDKPITVYTKQSGMANGGKLLTDGSGRGFIQFGGSSSTPEGLYIVTRTYVNDMAADSKDVKVLTYYFIVDRNYIIDETKNIGKDIKINLLENETYTNEFSALTTINPILNYEQDNLINQRYSIYLRTNKLPATLSIPVGKYIEGRQSSGAYFAGKLKFSLYFVDKYTQYYQISNTTKKIFEGDLNSKTDEYFNIDIHSYLSTVDINLRDRLTIKGNGNWIYLPGVYVIVLTDNVENGYDAESNPKYPNIRLIGFEIPMEENAGPSVELETGYSNETVTKANVVKTTSNVYDYELTTSDEFVKFMLPEYVTTEKSKAQVDTNYLVVKQYENSDIPSSYINHEYTYKEGEFRLTENSKFVTVNANGSKEILLNTKLRDDNGNIITSNLNNSLYYTITIRFKLSESISSTDFGGVSDKYKQCYVYYDNNQIVEYYFTTYRVIIDRKAPTKNVETLINGYVDRNGNTVEKDQIIDFYNEQNNTDSMFESSFHDTKSKLYFTNQYSAYYATKLGSGVNDMSLLYALRVTNNTPFNNEETTKLLYREFNHGIDSLSLPIIDESIYPNKLEIASLKGIKSYSFLGGLSSNSKYYEIVEFDNAGNATQYIVLYSDKDEINIPISYKNMLGQNADASISFETQETIRAYEVYGSDEVFNGDDENYFYRIELLKDGVVIDSILTNFTTMFEYNKYDDNSLSTRVASMINSAGEGSFALKILSRNSSNIVPIIIQPKNTNVKLNAADLFKADHIELTGANKVVDGIPYYAEYVEVKCGELTDIYKAQIIDGVVIYNLNEGESGVKDIELYWTANSDITYKITITDNFGNKDTHRYNTAGKKFHEITFAGVGNSYYEDLTDTYYSYTDAIILYDNSLINNFNLKVNGITVVGADLVKYITHDILNGQIMLKAPYDVITNLGDVYKFEIVLLNFDGEQEGDYAVVIDTKIPAVNLRDFASADAKSMEVYNNVENIKDCKPSTKASGIMTLSWSWPINDYFTYEYKLYSSLKDDIVTFDETDNYININESGTYHLEIKVYSIEGVYLGNKVYAFLVGTDNNLYSVEGFEKENSSFKFAELFDNSSNGLINLSGSLSYFINKYNAKNLPTSSIPLYISNKKLTVLPNEDLLKEVSGEDKNIIIQTYIGTNFTLHLYEIKAQTFSKYLGLLEVNDNGNALTGIVKNVSINGESIQSQTSFTIAGYNFDPNGNPADDKQIVISWKNALTDNYLMNKNNLILEVYHNNILANKINYLQNYTYTIKGDGNYVFKFTDLAGNVHVFTEDVDALSIVALREIAVTINNEVPVDNAYYNDAVELRVYASTRYVTGSIGVRAFRNGVEIPVTSTNPAKFSLYGSYRVIVTGKFSDGNHIYNLSKIVTFTIIDENEVRPSIDLTNLMGYQIESITKPDGTDVTDVFNTIFNTNLETNGMLVDYNSLLDYADELEISSGKQKYCVTYSVKDVDYPKREISFSFTLNNEKPKIDCTLQAGESTTKSFGISFNAGILYEQIGSAYVYINDELIMVIDETSSYDLTTINKSFKEHGAGDYYIKLVGSSGNVWTSYKATIQEPLNAWAIIIIVVVVAVVVGITVTVIVLRNKMRIR